MCVTHLRVGQEQLGVNEADGVPLELLGVELEGVPDLAARQGIAVLEQQQDGHLKGLYGHDVGLLEVAELQFGLAEVVKPRQLPPVKPIVVELLELEGTKKKNVNELPLEMSK